MILFLMHQNRRKKCSEEILEASKCTQQITFIPDSVDQCSAIPIENVIHSVAIPFQFTHTETNPLVEDAENSKVDYAFDNPAFKGAY